MRNRDEPANGPMGLTKLETAAIAAMQGILASTPSGVLFENIARDARRAAAALFNELDSAEAEPEATAAVGKGIGYEVAVCPCDGWD